MTACAEPASEPSCTIWESGDGIQIDTADEPLPGSDVVDRCGASGARIVMIGREVMTGAVSRLTCPRSIGPDGGTCHAR
ncbi:MAG: hypothetical protein M3Y87_27305 [Myxococcota bacterium]|nr:hypothetical protein [Myxococcota bacterium]